MARIFVGMIVGAVSTIFAADGAATADRIIMNASMLVSQSGDQPDFLLMMVSGWGVMAVSMTWWKRRKKQPEKVSKYAYLLR